jgi:hypothetical protein
MPDYVWITEAPTYPIRPDQVKVRAKQMRDSLDGGDVASLGANDIAAAPASVKGNTVLFLQSELPPNPKVSPEQSSPAPRRPESLPAVLTP